MTFKHRMEHLSPPSQPEQPLLHHTEPLVYVCSSGPGGRKRSCSWWQLRKVREVSEVLHRLLQVWCSLKV